MMAAVVILLASLCSRSVGPVAGWVAPVHPIVAGWPVRSSSLLKVGFYLKHHPATKLNDDPCLDSAGHEIVVTRTNTVQESDWDPSIVHKSTVATVLLGGTFTFLLTVFPSEAIATTNDAIPSALWAYGHYATILTAMGAVVAERFMIKPDMTQDEEGSLFMTDVVYWISIILVVVTGYYRMTEFGKGTYFYTHEVLFWIKMSLVGVLAGLALFPTITLIKRKVTQTNDTPMSDALVERMKKVFNAELSAILFIPLNATFMARGVLYSDDFPIAAGLALVILSFGASSFLYGKQAITWKEEDASSEAGSLESLK